jgi:hypothetical protein
VRGDGQVVLAPTSASAPQPPIYIRLTMLLSLGCFASPKLHGQLGGLKNSPEVQGPPPFFREGAPLGRTRLQPPRHTS